MYIVPIMYVFPAESFGQQNRSKHKSFCVSLRYESWPIWRLLNADENKQGYDISSIDVFQSGPSKLISMHDVMLIALARLLFSTVYKW